MPNFARNEKHEKVVKKHYRKIPEASEKQIKVISSWKDMDKKGEKNNPYVLGMRSKTKGEELAVQAPYDF